MRGGNTPLFLYRVVRNKTTKLFDYFRIVG